MKPAGTLSTLVTVLAAALIGIAPMASHAAVYTPASPVELGSDSHSDPSQCSLEQSSTHTSCSNSGLDQTTKASDLTQTVKLDYQQTFEQADATSVLLEDLIKSGPDLSVEEL
jgi:hypothetical protein